MGRIRRTMRIRRLESIVGLGILLAVSSGCGREGGNGKDAAADLTQDAADDLAQDRAAPDVTAEAEAVNEYPWDDHTLTIMTFNVLCSFCGIQDGLTYDPWEDRLPYFTDMFERHKPDIIGSQELFVGEEAVQILEQNPGYTALFWADEEQEYFKSYADATIFYRTERFEVVENGFYWLSEDPDVPLTGGWADSNLARLVAWAHFRQVSDGRDFYFSDTHFDPNSPNQEMSAPLFVERTAKFASKMPAIVVGDFNSRPDSEAYAIMTAPHEPTGIQLVNAFDAADQWDIDTNQVPVPDYDTVDRIDHIFYAGDANWHIPYWIVDMHVYGENDLYPSDHFAMIAQIEL